VAARPPAACSDGGKEAQGGREGGGVGGVPSPPVSPRLGNAGGGFFLYPGYLRDPIFCEPKISLSCATRSINALNQTGAMSAIASSSD
jgi:hypothetical protein